MALVNVSNIRVLKEHASFTDPFSFEIEFEAVVGLQDDLEWKLIYVGSAENEAFDQELDSILVGPIPQGANKFIFEADAPKPSTIPEYDLLGVTVILITCSYRNQEFLRVGYYVNNEYTDIELINEPPEKPIIGKLFRNVLSAKPRVTRFAIKWD